MEHALRPPSRQDPFAVWRLNALIRSVAQRAARTELAAFAAFTAAFTAFAALTSAAACASMGMPPGGRPDKSLPAMLKVAPDTGALDVRPREVVFTFDRVISESPRGAASLEALVLISPSDGPVSVDWRRRTIGIRPRRGWRTNTAYTVTILPGLADLQGNVLQVPLRAVFSTGGVIPLGAVRGVAFDWVGQRAASGARIEATYGADTALRYLAAADSSGRFEIGRLPAGELRLRVYGDQNGNRALDPREIWDTASMSLVDSARTDFYLFAHDSVGPRIADVAVIDSLALRVRFDKPLGGARIDATSFSLTRARDSVAIPLARALPSAAFDSVAASRRKARADSIARADTSTAGRLSRSRADSLAAAQVRDSIAQAQIAAVRASRDTVRRVAPPKPARAAPAGEYVLELGEPLPLSTNVRLVAKELHGLSGNPRTSERSFSRRPAPKDSAGAPATKAGGAAGAAPPAKPAALAPPGTPPVTKPPGPGPAAAPPGPAAPPL